MRLLLALAVYAALTVSGFAQQPAARKESVVTDTIRIQAGETRVVRFQKPFKDLILSDLIVQMNAESDMSVSIRPVRPGEALLTVLDPTGGVIDRINIVVPGGFVRIYGTNQTEGTAKDFAGYICSESGCTRTDVEVDKTSSSGSVSVSRRNSLGGFTTTTRNY